MNAGKKRILIGSSVTMGSGVNAHRRLVALHHLDVPGSRPRSPSAKAGSSTLTRFEASLLDTRNVITQAETWLPSLRSRLGVPFAHQAQLDDRLAELAAINPSLAATTADADALPVKSDIALPDYALASAGLLCSRVEEGRGCWPCGVAPFLFPAHQTGRARLRHPAFRLI